MVRKKIRKQGVSWTIGSHVIRWLEDQADISGKSVSFYANHYLEENMKLHLRNSEEPPELVKCEVCGNMISQKLNFCPFCRDIENKKDMDKCNNIAEQIKVIETIKEVKQESDKKLNRDENIKRLRKQITNKKDYLNSIIKNKKQYVKDDGIAVYEKIVEEQTNELKQLEKELQREVDIIDMAQPEMDT